MIVTTTIAETRAERARLGRLAFVPTMGALHAGHLSLVHEAKKHADSVAISIFVNPAQFAPHEDLSKYPRPLERDLSLCEEAGAHLVFVPTVEEMYTPDHARVTVHHVSERLEGAVRPTHFEGVATVVTKLFNIFQPEIAVFGLKDLQQCAVLDAMVRSLCQPVQLVFAETVRESDGLALSSRNQYLSESERKQAPALYACLSQIRNEFKRTSLTLSEFQSQLGAFSDGLESQGFRVDYLELVDFPSMGEAVEPARTRIVVAARLGTTRLIDNISLG